MALAQIGVGTVANDGTGDTVRAAFQKVNANNLLFGTVTANNVTTSDPGVSNDGTQGYAPGSKWFNTASGVEWVCFSNSTGAAVWVAMGAPSHVGLASGRWYSGVRAISENTLVVAADTLYAIPILIPHAVTLQALGMRVSAGAVATSALLGIYANSRGGPTSLVTQLSAAVGTTAAADVSGSFASNPTLPPAPYWLASLFNGAPTMITAQTGDRSMGCQIGGGSQTNISGAGAVNIGVSSANTFVSGLPGTFPALTLRNLSTPAVNFQVA